MEALLLSIAIIWLLILGYFWATHKPIKKTEDSPKGKPEQTHEPKREAKYHPSSLPYCISIKNTTDKDVLDIEVFNYDQLDTPKEGIIVEGVFSDLKPMLAEMVCKPFWLDAIYVFYSNGEGMPTFDYSQVVNPAKGLMVDYDKVTEEQIKEMEAYYLQRNKLGIQFYDLPLGQIKTEAVQIEAPFDKYMLQLNSYLYRFDRRVLWDSSFTLIIPKIKAGEKIDLRIYPTQNSSLTALPLGQKLWEEKLLVQMRVRQSFWNRSILAQRFADAEKLNPYVKPNSPLLDSVMRGFINVFVSSDNEVFFTKTYHPERLGFDPKGKSWPTKEVFEESLGLGKPIKIAQLLNESEDFEKQVISFADKTDGKLSGFAQYHIFDFFAAYLTAKDNGGKSYDQMYSYDSLELAKKAKELLFELTGYELYIGRKTVESGSSEYSIYGKEYPFYRQRPDDHLTFVRYKVPTDVEVFDMDELKFNRELSKDGYEREKDSDGNVFYRFYFATACRPYELTIENNSDDTIRDLEIFNLDSLDKFTKHLTVSWPNSCAHPTPEELIREIKNVGVPIQIIGVSIEYMYPKGKVDQLQNAVRNTFKISQSIESQIPVTNEYSCPEDFVIHTNDYEMVRFPQKDAIQWDGKCTLIVPEIRPRETVNVRLYPKRKW